LLDFLKRNEIIISTVIFTVSILFWDFKLNNIFQAKFLIVILLPYLFINYEIRQLKKLIFFSLILISFLFLHSLAKVDFQITYYFIFSLIFFYLLILIAFNFVKNFKLILKKSSIIFISISNLLIILSIILGNFKFYDHNLYYNGLCLVFFNENKSIFSYFFLENSHFGMTASAIIVYLLLNFNKINYLNKINFLIFLILSYLYVGSLTLYLGISISIISILVLRISKKFAVLSIFLLINTLLIFSLNNCLIRITQIIDIDKVFTSHQDTIMVKKLRESEVVNSLAESKFFKFLEEKTNIILINEEIKEKESFDENNKIKDGINVTTIIHINHLLFASDAIRNHLFGVGFQNYAIYAKKFAIKNKIIDGYSTMPLMNINDGASNINKLLAEFGIINILFIILFLFGLYKNSENSNAKSFILTLVITQLLRGAGYFNGGFIFFILILIFLTLKKR
tara:strand:- start:11337 stop:12698 length:1362 start_codon:yes stop_codon:yes gene_type:complete